ncbi:MAG TPA: single-stranded-DNA-specific exonuclease RecJ [Candidatus Hydrogenedentes bacterium]|nr:single-stranded-DNA-specific exonuclease RecJ [Candidatus Hydrogenedentota bacterium]HQL93545.1 single-stranded-DNA-specific exonuclease RecJ [Candidatus Hydrogenedentota bacterium]
MSAGWPKAVWNLRQTEYREAAALARAAGVPPVVGQLLLQRGVSTPEAARAFLNPSPSQLFDPFLLTGMRAAVDRVTLARDRGEKALVFGDYDVDGVSATALLTRALQRFGLSGVTAGMPDRLRDGYGIMPVHVERAHAEGVGLIVTVDNGTSAFAAAQRARDLGVGLVITDHHSFEGELPPADAVINPRREADGHPGAALCGAGVAFKLGCALNGTPNDLDMAALGTVSDMMPLVGENRVLVALGIRHMKRYERLGLARLAAVSDFSLKGVTSERISFRLGPRLNAIGRLDDARAALDLLLAECPEEAERLADLLDAANNERREIEQRIFNEAVEEIEALGLHRSAAIVVARTGWHQGVVGIVASRLVGRFHRTVAVLCVENGVARGSARAVPGVDLMEALNACRAHFTKYGGHRAAAGMTLNRDAIDAFAADFVRAVESQEGAGAQGPLLDVDAQVALSMVDEGLLRSLEAMEPFGNGNPAPVFAAYGVEVVPSSVRVLKDQHLKMSLRQGDKAFAALWFRHAERYFAGNFPALVDIAFNPVFDERAMDGSIQLILKDLRPAAG